MSNTKQNLIPDTGLLKNRDAGVPAWVKACVGILILIGLVARLSPLGDIEGRLFWQYMTEDGYLMQTVARNMAIGLGMSTAEGTIATNGVQPLATYLFAALHWFAGGDKTEGIVLVTLLSTLIAAVSAWLLALVARQVFSGLPQARELAGLAAALWFAAPLITRHSMNGLETGLYQASILLATGYYLARFSGRELPTWGSRLLLGVLLGLTFLARNDAVFFIAALLFAHLVLSPEGRTDTMGRRLIDALVAGVISIVVASPWLIHNYLGFGSIVPISGTAQSHAAEIGRNLPWVGATLFENTWLWLPLPSSIETLLPVQLMSMLAIVVVLLAYGWQVGRQTAVTRRHFVSGVLFALGLVAYYGLFFGANWFLPRYFSAVSPFLWLCTVGAVYAVALQMRPLAPLRAVAAPFVVMVLTVLAAAFAVKDYRNGTSHMHKQVVEWTERNVADEVWVGAPQTGTLGYFHDRTINLDGKVNPAALTRLVADGHILNYVLTTPVAYIVDWVGMAQWVKLDHFSPRFGQEFEVLVEDPAQNLAALKRRSVPQ
jgi:4-amino-4-deoxy-L-arabinose transferase-like glycosyltransferase